MRTSTYGRGDLHVHTLLSDGAQRPEAILEAASGRVDVVAITDHDEIRGALRAREWAREHPELGVDVVVGEEISTLNGHLLGLFLEECVPPGLSALETIGEIHAQGGLAVAAHPFHPLRGVSRGHASIARLIRDLPLDAIEAVNNAGVFSARTTSGTSAAQSRGSRAGTPTRCAGRSWPAVRAHTSTGPGPSASCPFISRSRRGPPTNFFDAIGNASPWELCRDRFGTDVRAAGRRGAGAPPAEARL